VTAARGLIGVRLRRAAQIARAHRTECLIIELESPTTLAREHVA
jgi:hypothetical protein